MDAGTLTDIIKKIGPIPEIILGVMAYQVLKGLEYLHKTRKVIHRDIKPSNILLCKKGLVWKFIEIIRQKSAILGWAAISKIQ